MRQLPLDLKGGTERGKGLDLSGMKIAALPCQRTVDAKAFTGRGGPGMTLRRDRDQLAQIHKEMAELSLVTRNIPGRTFYLQVHNRPQYKQQTLRWRFMGVKGGHIAWDEVQGHFDQQLPAMKAWYEAAHQRVLELNHREKLLRHQITMHEGFKKAAAH